MEQNQYGTGQQGKGLENNVILTADLPVLEVWYYETVCFGGELFGGLLDH